MKSYLNFTHRYKIYYDILGKEKQVKNRIYQEKKNPKYISKYAMQRFTSTVAANYKAPYAKHNRLEK